MYLSYTGQTDEEEVACVADLNPPSCFEELRVALVPRRNAICFGHEEFVHYDAGARPVARWPGAADSGPNCESDA
eukprot:CAMPEP_0180696218 /NCGR_PEP_ID=MMETSP1038_2-20121128/2857_1 /TAXON_ID=632150 /ORGANISM="Azadinium spinosum, Strain 3D9" /LENGTH=74 /DNA_ID=CAMNT_0022727673 /DNA_START=990 /DNA_END=1210 /DNA_ORIENTATION=+